MKKLPSIVVLLCLLGCSRPLPFQEKIESDTPLNFTMWRSKNLGALTPKERTMFNQAIDSLKLKIMLDRKASGGEGVDLALRTSIDGKSLGEVMRSGLKIRLDRLKADQSVMAESLAYNSQVKLRPDDTENAVRLTEKIQGQTSRLTELNAMIAEAESDLQDLETKCK